ncbi:MAG TPA: Ig-like domain repeat protein, partial [Ferruginibacter sp.]|nr:Ig-like domain repeat protein [Ferruginibacter sp.]
TSFTPFTNPYTGLATCVSLITAVAARVGTHRVTFQPNINGIPDPSGLQLRVDGTLKTPGMNGLDLGSGGRIVKPAIGDGIEIDFPNGTTLIVTPGWWASQSKWYLNVNIYHTTASEGVMGVKAQDSWLPALSNGGTLGPRPASLHDRYIDLNEKFADSWRVTSASSLFDYSPGTSTTTFTIDSWPLENMQCIIPMDNKPTKPLTPAIAQQYCREVVGKNRKAHCVFDVAVTGETGFAKTYLLTQRIEIGATNTTISSNKDSTNMKEPVTFTAIVRQKALLSKGILTGFVQFTIDGKKSEKPVLLNKGRAILRTVRLGAGVQRVAASYIPSKGSKFLSSTSTDENHTVSSRN